MPSAAALRQQIEAALADRIPSALTPVPRVMRPVTGTGIPAVDEMLEGGLPLGAISEIVGPECSGRTSFAFSFLNRITRGGKVCAWVDASDTFHPESAAAAGVHLPALLWIRCGVAASRNESQPSTGQFTLPEKYLVPPPTLKDLHGGGCGGHPRNEVKGLSDAVGRFLQPSAPVLTRIASTANIDAPAYAFNAIPHPQSGHTTGSVRSVKPWVRIKQALWVTDQLLQGGGFSAIVLDMGSIAPEDIVRVPLGTWLFCFRAVAEKSQTSILLLTQHACAKSSAGLVLQLQPGNALREETTVFAGIDHHLEVVRERFKAEPPNVIPMREPPRRATKASWQSRATWAGAR